MLQGDSTKKHLGTPAICLVAFSGEGLIRKPNPDTEPWKRARFLQEKGWKVRVLCCSPKAQQGKKSLKNTQNLYCEVDTIFLVGEAFPPSFQVPNLHGPSLMDLS